MKQPYGSWSVLQRLALAQQARRWVRFLSLHASRFYLEGVQAPALVDDIAEVHRNATELGGGPVPS